MVQCAGCRVQGAGCRVQGAGCRVQGAGCRVVSGMRQGVGRSRANMAHTRQSRPDSGLDFQVKVLTTFRVVPSSLGSVSAFTVNIKTFCDLYNIVKVSKTSTHQVEIGQNLA